MCLVWRRLFCDLIIWCCSLVEWSWTPAADRRGEAGGSAEYQAETGGSVTVYVDSGRGHTGATLGGGSGAGYSRVDTVELIMCIIAAESSESV